MQWEAFEAFAVSLLQPEAAFEKVAKEVIKDVFKEVVK